MNRLNSLNRANRANSSVQSMRPWFTKSIYRALDAVNDNRLPSSICDFRKGRYAKPKLLADFRNTGALSSFGTVTPPTYSTSTGAGIAYRVDASNQSGVQFAATANKVYELDLEAGPTGIITRSGTSLAGSIAHNGLAANVRQKVYLVAIGPLVFIAANANGTTCSYTLHSIREVDMANMEEATFADLFTFTRAGTATYIDQGGVLRTAANDVPRFDYSNGYRQLRLEGSATNLLLSSSNLNISPWGTSRITKTSVAGLAPNGLMEATLISETTDNGTHSTTNTYTKSGTQFQATFSVFLKAGTSQYAHVRMAGALGSLHASVPVDLQTGTLGPVYGSLTNASAKIKAIGNGWYRVEVTGLSDTTTQLIGIVLMSQNATSGNPSYIGDPSKNFLAWGGQLETGDTASSYIETTTGAVTRAADMCRLSPMAEAILQRTDASMLVQGRLLSLVAGGSNQALLGGANVAGIPALILAHGATANGVGTWNGTQALWAVGSTNLSAGPFGVGAVFSAAGRSAAVNGGAAANDNYAAGDRTQVYLGRAATGIFANGWYDQLVIWPFRMTDAALQGKAVAYAA